MNYASIDIGTNTLRLFIADISRGALEGLVYKRAITRLGGNYTEKNGIDRASAERTISTLEDFKKVIVANNVSKVFPVATSVVRRAVNREWFLGEVYNRTGLNVSVINGEDEARLSVLGVLSVVGGEEVERLVIDIGGGSTEFILCHGGDVVKIWSLEMGVVHLTEKYLKSDPPLKSELDGMEREIRGVIAEIGGVDGKRTQLVGTAGTITTLCALDMDMAVYDRNLINNYVLKHSRIRAIYDGLIKLRLKERREVLTLEKGREDLIIPGALIILVVMEMFGFDCVKTSDAGLLEGVLLNELYYKKGGLA